VRRCQKNHTLSIHYNITTATFSVSFSYAISVFTSVANGEPAANQTITLPAARTRHACQVMTYEYEILNLSVLRYE